MAKRIRTKTIKSIAKGEVISVRFPVGTMKEIREISDALYYGRSVSDYIKECVLCNAVQDRHILNDRRKI
jgi:hypothetical protein